jgi:hypothetical protein
MTVSFEQAVIKVEKEKEFEALKGAITRVFSPERVEKFLKRVQSEGIRVRDWDKVTAQRVFERVDEGLKKSGTIARQLYDGLPLSDQAQMREFYLSKLEEVGQKLRTKYQKIYRYY